jgi:hypothetical protein
LILFTVTAGGEGIRTIPPPKLLILLDQAAGVGAIRCYVVDFKAIPAHGYPSDLEINPLVENRLTQNWNYFLK